MSDVLTQAQARAAILAALDGVTAMVETRTVRLHPYPTRPKTISAYDVWPVWLATRPTAMCVDETDWAVIVALPGADAQTWSVNGDALVTAVAAALHTWQVSRVEPASIPVADNAAVPCLNFTVTM